MALLDTSASRPRIGFLDRLHIGFKLSVDSIAVIRHHPRLVVFPVLGAVSSMVFFAALLAPLVFMRTVGAQFEIALLVALLIAYFVTTFLASFFTAALVIAVDRVFHGQQVSIRDGVRAAATHWRSIAAWAIISAIVGSIINALERRGGFGLALARTIFGIAWAVATFFIIPVIVFEDVGVREMFERSGRTFVDTWGESIAGGLGLGLIMSLVGLVVAGLAFAVSLAVGTIAPWAFFPTAVILIGFALVITYFVAETAIGIAKTALYVYAVEAIEPAEFADFEFATLDGSVAHDESVRSPAATG